MEQRSRLTRGGKVLLSCAFSFTAAALVTWGLSRNGALTAAWSAAAGALWVVVLIRALTRRLAPMQ
jgi:hypothetical protein